MNSLLMSFALVLVIILSVAIGIGMGYASIMGILNLFDRSRSSKALAAPALSGSNSGD